MATLTAWKFDSAEGARNALTTLERLQREQLITLIDGAVVTWPSGAKKPKTEQMHNTAAAGALGGAFWRRSRRRSRCTTPRLPARWVARSGACCSG
jgi:uncharacterized membrane protein